MSKKHPKRVNLKKSNLNPNGTTIDGGFPRHTEWVNPYDWWKVAINRLIEIFALCIPLGCAFHFLLNVGILVPIIDVINGNAPFKSHIIFNLVVVGLFALALVVYPIVRIGDAIWYIKTGEKSFLLSRPIRKIWNRNLGQYDYKQHEYQDSNLKEGVQSSQTKEHSYEEDKYQMQSHATKRQVHAIHGQGHRFKWYDSNWQYYKNVEDEEEFSSRMLVLLIIEIIVFFGLKKLGIF